VLQHMDLRTSADRLGLVVDVDERLATVNVLLVSPLVEYRTAVDYLLEPAASASRIPFVVECDLRGAVRFVQLGGCVGKCYPSLAAQLDAFGSGALPDDIGLSQSGFGLPARDERDLRWAWKLAELDALNVLTHECEEWLANGAECSKWIDHMLFTDLATASPDLLRDLVGLFDAASEGPVFMPDEALEALYAFMSQCDPDQLRAVEPFTRPGLSPASPSSGSWPSAAWSHQRPDEGDNDSRLAGAIASQVRPAGRCASLITSTRIWAGSQSDDWMPPHIEVGGSSRIEVQFRFVDHENREAA